MDTKQIIALLDQELAWCNEHNGESAESADFEKGFVKGLEQAKYLILNAEKKIKNRLEDALARFANGA